MAELTSKRRKELPSSSFVFPDEREYPIHDKAHARNALARVAQHGTPAEKAKVRAAVRRKYPGIEQEETPRGRIRRGVSEREAKHGSNR